MHQKQSSQYVIGFSYEKSADAGIDNVFFLEESCRKMYTIFSAVQRQQRKSDVMTSLGLTACSAVYYQVPHCRFLIHLLSMGRHMFYANRANELRRNQIKGVLVICLEHFFLLFFCLQIIFPQLFALFQILFLLLSCRNAVFLTSMLSRDQEIPDQ
jgi:hypothetical protein